MSDEQPKGKGEPSEALTGPVQRTPVHGGGRLNGGGRVRPTQPTLADVNELARKRVYQFIPAMSRIIHNRPKKGAKKGPYSVAAQIAAFAELRRLAQDRTISESSLAQALSNITAEIVDHLGGYDAARPLLQKIAPHILEL